MLYACQDEKTISFSICGLPSAKFLLLTRTAEGAITGVARTEQAAVPFTQGSLQPPGVAEPVTPAAAGSSCSFVRVWGARASPRDAQASRLSAFDFPLLDLFSQTLFFTLSLFAVSLWRLLSLLPLIFISLCFFPFSSFSFPVPLVFLSCLLPNHVHYLLPFWSFSQGLNHSSCVCVAICMAQSHLPQLGALSWGGWSSVVTGKRWEPPEGDSVFKAVKRPCEDWSPAMVCL